MVASADQRPSGRFPLYSLLVCVLAIAAALALLYQPLRSKLDKIEYWTADWRTVLLADRTPDKHPRIVLVLFDPATFKGNIVSPIPRDDHARLLRTIAAMQPAAIGLDFYFVASQGPDPDKAMLDALHEIDRPLVVGGVDDHTNEFDDDHFAYQKQFLAEAGRPVGILGARLRSRPRRAAHLAARLPDSPFQESFARQVALAAKAELTGPGTSSDQTRIAWLVGPDHDSEPFFRISAKELLGDSSDARRAEIAQRIKGNIVLTGIAMPNSDLHDTALSVWTEQQDARRASSTPTSSHSCSMAATTPSSTGRGALPSACRHRVRRPAACLDARRAARVAAQPRPRDGRSRRHRCALLLGPPPGATLHAHAVRVVHRSTRRPPPARACDVGSRAGPGACAAGGMRVQIKAAGRSGSGWRRWPGMRQSTAPACGEESCAPGARRRAPPTR